MFLILNKNFKKFLLKILKNFLDEIKVFSIILMKTNLELLLTFKQILYLFDFVQVKEIFCKNGIPLKDNLQIYFNI